MFYVFLLYGLFASVFAISKTGLAYTEPLFFVGTRMSFAGLVLLGYQFFIKKQTFVFKPAIWRCILLLGVFNIYLTNIFEFWGLQYLTAAKTCFIYSLSPFLSALFSYFLFSERLGGKKWVGLIIGFLGFIPILINQTTNEENTGHFFLFSWAELAVIIATVCSVYGWILLKKLVSEFEVSPLSANGFSMIIGGGFALIHSLLVEDWNPVPITNFSVYLECTLLLILISNLVCYNLYGSLLKRYSATFLSLAGFTTPLFTALFGWLFLGEEVSMSFFSSFFAVLLGLLMFDQAALKKDLSRMPT